MNSLKTKSWKAAISTTDPLILILRNCRFVWELSDADWLNSYKLSVMAAGRVLQFLSLAEPDKQSPIGWKAKPRFFQIAKEAAPPNSFMEERTEERTEDDALLVDMLDGIAASVLFDEEFEKRISVLNFTYSLLERVRLMRWDEVDEWLPTPLVRELFMQGALKIGNAARRSSLAKRVVGSVDNSDRSPKSRASHSK
jgi:hypothetical protein